MPQLQASAGAHRLSGYYVDPHSSIELELPEGWHLESREELLLELCAPDDPWTVLQLSHYVRGDMQIGTLVDTIVAADARRWSLERRASLIHNGAAAVEADFALHLNGSAWIMRKLFLPTPTTVYALAFMTRFATWSRYSATYRNTVRSFSLCGSGSSNNATTALRACKPPQRGATLTTNEALALPL